MKLSIDTSDGEEVAIKLDGKEFREKARKQKSQRLLPLIEETLKTEGKSLQDLDEIEVNTGPGSFTGLRVGVSIANALGWALGIPVNGKNVEEEIAEIKYE
jgi:tRNA threonylcarbamoyladenosine biosynthesis protein TsaB